MTHAVCRRFVALLVLLASAMGLVASVQGHALEPGYLQLRLLDKNLYAVVWKVPAVGARPMAIAAQLPAACEPRTADRPRLDDGAWFSRWTARCPGGLEGGVVRIDGLEHTSTDVLVRFDFADGASETRRLTASRVSFTVPAQAGGLEVARTYLLLGAEHIALGIDHLLFVLALLLLVKGVRPLIVTVTAFTLAHSLTLAAATLGFLQVPGPPVEAVIALSIAFVAAEIIHDRRGQAGLASQAPWLIAFIFGLLHGLGFAGALADIGLPRNAIPSALLFFNVGVEAGQLLFIAAVLGARALVRRVAAPLELSLPRWSWAVPPYLIGSLAVFWFAQRISGF